MFGAIIGDIVGSVYEFHNMKTKNFPLLSPQSNYTDDSLMTIAVASALMLSREARTEFKTELVNEMRRIGSTYPNPMGGYGSHFRMWLASSDPKPYGSFGNGSAMRVSPCAEMASSMEEALVMAKQSAEVTHNHLEGIKGAQATAAAIYLAKAGESKQIIRGFITEHFYSLDQTIDEIRPSYCFNASCQGTVPQAITAFLESTDFEDALRTAVSLGGDSDTLADITCAIAWPYYAVNGIDETMKALRKHALSLLDGELRETVMRWERRYCGYDA